MLDGMLFLLIGLSLAIFGAACLGQPQRLGLVILALVTSKSQVFMLGIGVEIVGLLLLLNFGLLADDLFVIMSVIGWLAVAKGLFMTLAPSKFEALVKKHAANQAVLLITPILALSLGFFMILTSWLL